MAQLKSSQIDGNLTVSGQIDLNQMPIQDSTPIVSRDSYPGFIACKTFYRLNPNSGPAATGVFAQNPLSTTPQIVNMSGVIPSNLRGDIGAIEVNIEFYRIDTNGSIFMTKPRGSAGSGNAWTTYGYLFDVGITRQKEPYRINTDLNGDFEIWGHTSPWTPRIGNIYLRGIWLRA
jgi:hypothetical protein